MFNLPPSGMSPEMGEMVGDIISKFVDVIKNSDSKCVGQFPRVRVAIDVSKPLRPGVRLRLGEGGPVVWGDLFYEKLPNFCFRCGKIGHVLKDCCTKPMGANQMAPSDLPYGHWLRVNSDRSSDQDRLVASSFIRTGGQGGYQGGGRGKVVISGLMEVLSPKGKVNVCLVVFRILKRNMWFLVNALISGDWRRLQSNATGSHESLSLECTRFAGPSCG